MRRAVVAIAGSILVFAFVTLILTFVVPYISLQLHLAKHPYSSFKGGMLEGEWEYVTSNNQIPERTGHIVFYKDTYHEGNLCNNGIEGTYTTNNNRLKPEIGQMTLAACEDGIKLVYPPKLINYPRGLRNQSYYYSVDGDTLLIRDDKNIFELKRRNSPLHPVP